MFNIQGGHYPKSLIVTTKDTSVFVIRVEQELNSELHHVEIVTKVRNMPEEAALHLFLLLLMQPNLHGMS